MYRRILSETSRIWAMARISPSVMRGDPATSRAIISLLSLIRIIRTSLFPFLARDSFCPTGSSLIWSSRLFFDPSAPRFLATSICRWRVGCFTSGTAGLRRSASSASTHRPTRSSEPRRTSRMAPVAPSASWAMAAPGTCGWRRRAMTTSAERAGCPRICSSTSGGVRWFCATGSRSAADGLARSAGAAASWVMRFLRSPGPAPREAPGGAPPLPGPPPCGGPGGSDPP